MSNFYEKAIYKPENNSPQTNSRHQSIVNWSNLKTGNGAYVSALAVIGSDLYAGGSGEGGGSIRISDGLAANIAKWNGSSWS